MAEVQESGVQELEFQAEAQQLLQIVVQSIYAEREVFLRELISNAADALDKLRIESFRDRDLDVDLSDLHIDVLLDPEARTLTVRDNGIGMTRAETVEMLGTIARSGTAAFAAAVRAAGTGTGAELIGQFGVGFYASFMVADRVVVLTRRAGRPVAPGGNLMVRAATPSARPRTSRPARR